MASATTDQTPERLWLCMTDSNRTRVVSRALAKGLGMTVYMGPTMDDEGPVALVVADDAHVKRIAEARTNAAENQKSLFVTGNAKRSGADIYLDHDCDAGTLCNAIEGLRALRDYELGNPEESDAGAKALRCMHDGEFLVRTLEEARDLAMMVGRSCPRPEPVSVGLYVLLANAIEHGNLGFDATEKAKGLADGNWKRKLARRLEEPAYRDRRVRLSVHRGPRALSLIVQDDGEGIDAETAEMANPSAAGYRGKGIKLARSMGFTQLSYMGVGNTVEATIILTQPAEPEGARQVAV